MPIPITNALGISQMTPGHSATSVSQTSPLSAITGPDISAIRSRRPDQPDTTKVPTVQPHEMTMLRMLMKTGDTSCTTCSNNGRNNDTEVYVMPCSERIHKARPIGAASDKACGGN